MQKAWKQGARRDTVMDRITIPTLVAASINMCR